MQLPDGGNVSWPPQEWRPVYRAYREWSAWYAGDVNELASIYGGQVTHYSRASRWKFWERAGKQTSEHQARTQLHLPMGSNLAATGASLLFSERPSIIIPGEDAEAKKAEARLNYILDASDGYARLTEAAESICALGGGFLKVDWDTDLLDCPIISVVQADRVVPYFQHSRLVAATVWRVIRQDGPNWFRYMEHHTPGLVEYALYRGREDVLGPRVSLNQLDETADLEPYQDIPGGKLAIVYVPNIRPNRKFRGSWLGQSDYHGNEGLMDALDETWTSWLRDIRLGKARIMAPLEYLTPARLSTGANSFGFDMDQEVFSPLNQPPDKGAGITVSQFAIRVDEHERTANALVRAIAGHAGYAPQSFGLDTEGRAESGSALRIRERKSLMTQQKKRGYWESPVADLIETMQWVDREVFRSGVTPVRPSVTLADSLTEGEGEQATTVELMNRAGAISTEVKVRMLHPNWTDIQVLDEVDRLRKEQGLDLPDPVRGGLDEWTRADPEDDEGQEDE
jgi:A118 family predicted phage portal protein